VEYFVRVVVILCNVMAVAIVIRSLLSWFPVDPNNFLVVFLVTVTDPILLPLRRIIPRLDMIDLSPMVAILLFMFISWLLQAYAH
jgi:YggT family protein